MKGIHEMIANFKALNKGAIYMTICNEDFQITLFSKDDERIKDILDLFIYDDELCLFVFNDDEGNY